MEKIIQDLRTMSDECRHYEFLKNEIWYDIYFSFDRETGYETGGEPDEILSYYKSDKIEIHKIVCFKTNGEELLPDWDMAIKIEKLYNYEN